MNHEKFTLDQILEAIKGTRGIKSAVARNLGCEWPTVNNYAKRYATVREALETERETLIDTAELQLVKLVNSGDWDAVKYTLKTIGRKRGYVERTELTGEDGTPLIPIREVIVKLPSEDSVRLQDQDGDGE